MTATNLSATGNEVWFTQRTSGGDGQPVKVLGVAAAGGSLTVGVPVEAGSGDVLVKNAGSGQTSLSNAWPFQAPALPCGATQYGIGLGGANVATLSATGSPVTGTSFTMDVSGFNGDGTATLLVGPLESSVSLLGGTVLIYFPDPIVSASVPIAGGTGSLTVTLPAAGLVGFVQAAMQDASQPAGWAFSNGLRVGVCP